MKRQAKKPAAKQKPGVIEFNVTATDIRKANRLLLSAFNHPAYCCPISVAARRSGFPRWKTSPQMCWPEGKIPGHWLPAAACAFIHAYDCRNRREHAKPFRFVLRLT